LAQLEMKGARIGPETEPETDIFSQSKANGLTNKQFVSRGCSVPKSNLSKQ